MSLSNQKYWFLWTWGSGTRKKTVIAIPQYVLEGGGPAVVQYARRKINATIYAGSASNIHIIDWGRAY